jgi:hypothetical protein
MRATEINIETEAGTHLYDALDVLDELGVRRRLVRVLCRILTQHLLSDNQKPQTQTPVLVKENRRTERTWGVVEPGAIDGDAERGTCITIGDLWELSVLRLLVVPGS